MRDHGRLTPRHRRLPRRHHDRVILMLTVVEPWGRQVVGSVPHRSVRGRPGWRRPHPGGMATVVGTSGRWRATARLPGWTRRALCRWILATDLTRMWHLVTWPSPVLPRSRERRGRPVPVRPAPRDPHPAAVRGASQSRVPAWALGAIAVARMGGRCRYG